MSRLYCIITKQNDKHRPSQEELSIITESIMGTVH